MDASPDREGIRETTETVEAWARRYVLSEDLGFKLNPDPVPRRFAAEPACTRIDGPGRPVQLRPARRRERMPRPQALKEPLHRARVLHAFLHHEMQAAELMCWALLAFADSELEFRKGLLGVCLDEIRHMNMYRVHIESLGSKVGDFGVRDWFWKRVPACPTALAFVSLMGMGFEAANLEHAATFAARFREAGDETGAVLQERIGAEEIAHVRFATHWFSRWTGGCRFEDWLAQLPPPLSPWVLWAPPMAVNARRKAGMPPEFLDALAAYAPDPKGRPVAEPGQ